MKPLTIVILANCDAGTLGRSLPEMLAQQYDADYEVVVVRDTKKGEQFNVIESLMQQYTNLRTTYLPDKPQYVTDYDVEVFLGVKAANNDRILIVAPDFIPPSDNWLMDINTKIFDNMQAAQIAIGKADYQEGTSFLDKYSHRRKVRSALSVYCKDAGLNKSNIILKKQDAKLLSVTFSKEEYMSNPLIRKVIVQQICY